MCGRCDEVRLQRIQARVLARAREQNGGTPPTRTRKPTKRRKRETAGSIRNDGNGDRRGGKRTRIAPEEITRARLHLHGERRLKHVANHVTGIRRGVRQNYAGWSSLVPTAENVLRTNVPRASLLQVVGV